MPREAARLTGRAQAGGSAHRREPAGVRNPSIPGGAGAGAGGNPEPEGPQAVLRP
jgi:hypothetical protein